MSQAQPLRETSYGTLKRLAFISEAIERARPERILDVGCGTGADVTAPLARAFPTVQFVGSDSDVTSIAAARSAFQLPNLRFVLSSEPQPEHAFDMVIASEVLEHVGRPDLFLAGLRARLAPGGVLVLTLPNGYGPFELMAALRDVIEATGAMGAFRRLRRNAGTLSDSDSPATASTLADSPHLHFFSFGGIQRLAETCGFRVRSYRPRTVLCGFGLDLVVRGQLVRWNAAVADHLPPWLSSDWMFVLGPTAPEGTSTAKIAAERSWYRSARLWLAARARRRLREA